METIINAFKEYFDSSLPKSDLTFRIGFVFFAFVLGAMAMWLFQKYFWNKNRTNKLVELNNSNKTLLSENNELKEKLKKYQKQFDMDILTAPDNNSDKALESLISK